MWKTQILDLGPASFSFYLSDSKSFCRQTFRHCAGCKRGRLGTGVGACLSKMISTWIHPSSSNHIHYYHCRLHHQVSLPEPQLRLNLAILPKLYSNSESSPEFACTLQNQPFQTIINSFFFVPYFNLCANQPSRTLQDLWMLASVTFHCHELRLSIVWNVNICTRGFASSFDINHIVFLLQACLRTWMGWSWLFDQCSFKGSFDCVIIQLDNE